MNYLKVDNYIINVPLINIVNDLKYKYTSRKLNSVTDKGTEIVLTCVNKDHSNGCEQNPDAHINLDSSKAPFGWYHCFACGLSCSFVGFIQHYFECSYDYAKEWLIKNYGILAEEKILMDNPIDLRKKQATYLDESILDQYQNWTPYFLKRRISREVCENFKLRYDPKYRQVIFPVYDIKGRLKMLAKRSIDSKIFYLDKNQEKEVYGLNIVQKNNINTVLITEGPFDMLSGWTHGIPTVATLGNISDYQIAQINSSCITTLYLGFDNDTYGQKFADLLKNRLDKRILLIDVTLPKNKKDLNDLTDDDWQDIINKYFLDAKF